jgi:hypothetical protein
MQGGKVKKEYDTFVNNIEDIAEEQELTLIIRDLTPGNGKYSHRRMKAIVSSSPDRLPEGDILWIRFRMGILHTHPWAIKITEELGI